MKTKKCKICKEPFIPVRPLQICCSPTCAMTHARNKGAKATAEKYRREARTRRQAINDLRPTSYYIRHAQSALNRYVRLRDKDQGCISCDKPSSWYGQWHASHFRPAGNNSAIRFNLWNIHKSCSICNNWKSGNLAEYEPNLRVKIGDAKVDWLKSQTQSAKYNKEYLERLKKVFTKKANRLERRQKEASG